jgi:hypothetical protein
MKPSQDIDSLSKWVKAAIKINRLKNKKLGKNKTLGMFSSTRV